MARRLDREKALQFRRLGWSYSQIKKEIGVSKATLSDWLHDLPLSKERIHELSHADQRIEKYRQTMKNKRQNKSDSAYKNAQTIIGTLNKREIFLAGLFLYWGEGGKTGSAVTISNTDPNIMKFFVLWANNFGIFNDDMKVSLHLYADMDEKKEKEFWADILSIPLKNFRKTYRKTSTLTGLSYKNGFGHGTCMVRIYDKKLADLVMMSIKYLGMQSNMI